ncbi:hypothetical protein BKA66DRAFT_421569 [Pyrenochaeta sp. MPI-SDFR-AT-0127]|nr:hypothetical protein BKA66DRAFT_421569 [Pyrenochaeta sp. MPI-SDFR-AT-0127]
MQQESPLSEATPISPSSQQASIAASESNHNNDITSTKITRKSHRKSRAGCKNCKTRRIKCDETKPHCANCKRRQVRCDYYSTPTTTSTSISGNHDDGLHEAGALRISEIELTYHWTTSTCHTLSANASGAAYWQNLMVDVGFTHHHVLRLMFAFTALHLASCRPDRRDEYDAIADQYYEHALASVTHDLANINFSNCDGVFVSVQLICFVNWARRPRRGEYLAFGEHGRSEWLVMFRGVRTILKSRDVEQFEKTQAPNVRAKHRPLTLASEPDGYEKQFQELREHVSFTSGPAEHDDNIRAVDILQECYSNRYGGQDGEYHIAFSWLYRMDDDFLERLQQRDPLPLILYAHFAVLMHDMERFWYMKGWTHHVMSGIFAALPREHRSWIRWPMATVGWVAP